MRRRLKQKRSKSDPYPKVLFNVATSNIRNPIMIKQLMSSRRFAPLFWAQFCSALNDNVLKNALVIILLYSTVAGHGDALVTVAGAVFIFPFFILSRLGAGLADKQATSA